MPMYKRKWPARTFVKQVMREKSVALAKNTFDEVFFRIIATI